MTQQAWDGMERSVFRDTASKMTFVGIFWVILAGIAVLIELVAMAGVGAAKATGMQGGGSTALTLVLALVDGGAMLGAGIYTILTAVKLKRVVAEKGNPIDGIMDAVGDLGRMFMFYAAAVAIDVVTDVVHLGSK